MEEKKNDLGRPLNFETPEKLLEVWNNYKEFRKSESVNWPKVQYVGKDGERVEDYPVLPLTMDGFTVYCYNNGHGSIKQYFGNQGNSYTLFLEVCSRIKSEIRDQQITGGMLGQFNPSITQRLNGLTDKQEIQTDITTDGKPINNQISVEIITPKEDED